MAKKTNLGVGIWMLIALALLCVVITMILIIRIAIKKRTVEDDSPIIIDEDRSDDAIIDGDADAELQSNIGAQDASHHHLSENEQKSQSNDEPASGSKEALYDAWKKHRLAWKSQAVSNLGVFPAQHRRNDRYSAQWDKEKNEITLRWPWERNNRDMRWPGDNVLISEEVISDLWSVDRYAKSLGKDLNVVSAPVHMENLDDTT
jgi:hypothetical protein